MVSSSTILKEISSLRARDYLPRNYVAFHEDLFQEQREAKIRFREQVILDDIPKRDLELTGEGGAHLLDIDRLRCPEEMLRTLFQRICALFEKYGQWSPAQTERLNRAVAEGDILLQEVMNGAVLKDMTYLDSVAETVQIEKDALYFLGLQMGKPFFELLAQEVRGDLDEGCLTGGHCPICGQEPAMAKLEREEGHRVLHCSLCHTDWHFPRLQCPFCLNDDQETLRFFFVEEASPYRVDVCDVCRRYVKTVDERQCDEEEEFHLEVEHIGTVFLDILAASEGYQGPHHFLFKTEKEPILS